MKYEEIIGLYEYFQPVVDITEERGDYWKRFIPTKDFLNVLETFLTALESKDANRKSIWLQGSYGTGKTHATTVIKHLLWDPMEEIENFVEKLDPQVREKLRNFRKEKRVFPVILKGISGINDVKSFNLHLEKGVKEALQREKIEINTESEFEKYINHIQNTPYVDYEQFIEGNIELKAKVRNKEGLLNALERRDIEILKLFEDSLDFSIPHPVIEDWLVEVSKELSIKGIYALTIYWDEFTSLMELENVSNIMSILQSIAEKTFNNNIFLFIISHRDPQQTTLPSEDYKKLRGRFHSKEYSMEKITTFHIISNAIRKKDEERWKNLREEVFNKNPGIERLIWRIAGDDLSLTKALKDIFPIHPYTAINANFISNYVGSAERSIFSFLNDSENGFLKFIKEYPKKDADGEEYLLTSDMLWDFFLSEFERNSSEKINSILVRYKQGEKEIRDLGDSYLAVFKGVLLLNILYSLLKVSIGDVSLFSPSEENILDMFKGSSFQDSIPDILNYIDKKGYIPKDPNGLFLVNYSALPEREVAEEREKTKKKYEDITKTLSEEQKERLKKELTSNILRETNIQLYWTGIKDYELKIGLKNDFKNPYSIPIALFIAKEGSEINEIENTIKRISNDNDINTDDIVFAISNTPLTRENYERFIDYLANATVADKHQYREDAITYRDYSEKLIDHWINKIENGYFEIYFRKESIKILGKNFDSHLNEEISPKIFWSGLENLKDLTYNINVWKKINSEKVLDIFIFAQDRNDLEERTKNAPYKDLRAILEDNKGNYIVDNKLNFIKDIDTNHPTYRICKSIEEAIKKYEGKTFNLGDTLRFLQKPPFGIYQNMVNYAVLAFAMRPFVDKLYEEGTGRRIDKNLLKEKLSILFKYWEDSKDRDKLNLRFGTEDERNLTNLLVKLFKLKEEENLNKARWGIREWIKNAGYPIWSLKSYAKDNEIIQKSIDLIYFLSRTADREITEEYIKKILSVLSIKKDDLSILLSPQNLKEGFKKWLEEELKGDIDEEKFENIMKFLRENMQEEVGLWEEDKIRAQLKDWVIYESQEEVERDFIRLISRIFGLEHITDLESLQREVRGKVNNLGLPLWTLKYVFKVEAIGKALDDIDDSIRDTHINSETFKEFLNDIRPYETLIHSNLTTETAKQGLGVWIKEKTSLNLGLDSFISYVKGRINKEPYLWEEQDLERVLKEYNFSKTMGEIFGIEEVLPIEDLKANIKRKIEDLSYPFWLLESSEDGEKIFSHMDKFLRSSYTTIEDLESMFNNISNEKVEELLREDNLRGLYAEWIREQFRNYFKLKTPLEDYMINEILEEMRRKIPPENFHWNKTFVENWIYRNEELKKKVLKNLQEKTKTKIASSNKDLKDILLKIIEDYPEVCIKLEEYLE
ncbi:hypothetical protein FY122_02095 [Dictyoglomus thermophilum]|uniref:hypothetical protein n=1 Tax=Dictyoglomus thermophilum TaxID=14 RepID=UPI0011EB6BE4|nr:hypothetical protein [Dictyoglomus thermophilum]TYT24349.1 hypothetical protein FY122_02095 [Dictyoglomus thermophilum]